MVSVKISVFASTVFEGIVLFKETILWDSMISGICPGLKQKGKMRDCRQQGLVFLPIRLTEDLSCHLPAGIPQRIGKFARVRNKFSHNLKGASYKHFKRSLRRWTMLRLTKNP